MQCYLFSDELDELQKDELDELQKVKKKGRKTQTGYAPKARLLALENS